MSNLADKVVVARLRKTEFPYYVTLKGKGKEVEQSVMAESNTVRDPQQRMFKHWDNFNNVKDAYAGMYNWYVSVTREWDRGERLMPAADVIEHLKKFGELRSNAENILDKMESEYDHQVAMDKIVRGNASKDSDYPITFAAFRGRFNADLELDPIGNPNDIRNISGFSKEEVDKMIKQAEDRLQDRLNSGVKDLVERLMKPVQHLGNVLSEEDKRFKKNSLDNVLEAVGTCRKLNVTDDPKLEEFLAGVEKELFEITPESLRYSPALKKEVANKAKELTAKMKEFLG